MGAVRLQRPERIRGHGFHVAPDLLRKYLLPSAKILPFAVPATRQ